MIFYPTPPYLKGMNVMLNKPENCPCPHEDADECDCHSKPKYDKDLVAMATRSFMQGIDDKAKELAEVIKKEALTSDLLFDKGAVVTMKDLTEGDLTFKAPSIVEALNIEELPNGVFKVTVPTQEDANAVKTPCLIDRAIEEYQKDYAKKKEARQHVEFRNSVEKARKEKAVANHSKDTTDGIEDLPETWSFSGKVAASFDQHVRTQLPWYDDLSHMVSVIANHFLPNKGVLYDIGCSTGNMTAMLRGQIKSKEVEAINIDNEPDMEQHFHGEGVFLCSNAEHFHYEPFNVAISMLTMGFVPVPARASLLARLYSQVQPGGVIIIVEKTVPRTPVGMEVMRRATLHMKTRQGVSAEKVLEKEFSLAGILKPLDPSVFQKAEIPSHRIEQFFQFGEFCGWLIYGLSA